MSVYRFWIDDWTFRIAGREHLFELYFLAKQLDFDMSTAESPNTFFQLFPNRPLPKNPHKTNTSESTVCLHSSTVQVMLR